MESIFFCILNTDLPIRGDLRVFREQGRFVYFSKDSYEDKDFIILKFGDIYEAVPLCGDDYKTIIENYKIYGEDCFAKLEGDFAVIIYSKKEKKLIAGRDKFGVKSLYYYHDEKIAAFSSRTLSFFEYLPVKKEANERKHFLYVGSHYRYFDASREETFFANIFSVKQGHFAYLEHGKAAQKCYWDLELLDLSNSSEEDLKAGYISLLSESIKSRLAKSRNPAFMISSGMDSSTVVALSSRILNRKLNIFTTVFEEDVEYNEANEITAAAKKFGEKWNRLAVKGNDIKNDLEKILGLSNEPFATITQMLHYYLTKEVKAQGFDSVFGGLGGDEANCGEIEEYLLFFADLRSEKLEERLKKEIGGWIKNHGHPLYPKSRKVAEDFLGKSIDFKSCGVNYLDEERFSRYVNILNVDFKDRNFNKPVLVYPYDSYLMNKLYQDLFFETIPCVLRAEEFNLNNFGLKGRMPYFDGKVMQYGFSIPVKLKYKNGANKAILREAMQDILPDETVHNFVKKGWNAPFNKWLKAYLKDSIYSILSEPTERQKKVYNLSLIKRLFEEHLADRTNHMMFFWQLLNYEMWYRIHFG